MTTVGRAAGLALLVAARPIAVRAQAADSVMMAAITAENAGQFATAAQRYIQAYALTGFDPPLLAAAALAAAHAGQDSVAISTFRRAVDEGVLSSNFLHALKADSALARLRSTPAWRSVVADAERRIAALNQPLRAELLDLAKRDQKNREGIGTIITRYGRHSPQGDSVMRALDANDAPLLARLRAIVSAHGWPTRSLVADDGAHAAWLILQHAPTDVQRELLPSVRRAVEHGEGRPGDLALLEDRVRVADGQPQRYGSQLKYSETGGPPTLEPLLDPPCVDVRRAAVGLEPLAAYLKRMGVAYAPPATPCHSGDSHARPDAYLPRDAGRRRDSRVVVRHAPRAARGRLDA